MVRFAVIVGVFLLGHGIGVRGQTVSGTSVPLQLAVGQERPQGKPGLAYGDVELRDENNNKTVEAWEKASIVFSVRNLGKGPSQNLVVSAYTANEAEVKGLLYARPLRLDSLLPGKGREVTIPVEGSLQLNSGIATVTIEIREEFEYSADQIEINVLTAEFQPPKLRVASYSLEVDPGNQLNDLVMATLKLTVANQGAGPAADTRLDLYLPDHAKQLDPPAFVLNGIAPQESRQINFRFYIHPTQLTEEVPVRAVLIERHQKYGQDVTLKARKKGK
ncbi:MAG: hypothetical protein ICV83_22295 [Cytophagales bacterium]|nr:hypothetical protein [Cytophagales bacterium]